jgi:hypothetical protein
MIAMTDMQDIRISMRVQHVNQILVQLDCHTAVNCSWHYY